MVAQVAAYKETIYQLTKKVVPMGGFWWQLMDSGGMKLNNQGTPGKVQPTSAAECKTTLRSLCVGANTSATPSAWNRMQMFNVPSGGNGVTPQQFTDYTAEFLLTRGPYAMLGYSWCGCTNGEQMRPRAAEWDEDFGSPMEGGAACKETGEGTGVFSREWSGATVEWNCNAKPGTAYGKITRK